MNAHILARVMTHREQYGSSRDLTWKTNKLKYLGLFYEAVYRQDLYLDANKNHHVTVCQLQFTFTLVIFL